MYPGASPQEEETSVTKAIEDDVKARIARKIRIEILVLHQFYYLFFVTYIVIEYLSITKDYSCQKKIILAWLKSIIFIDIRDLTPFSEERKPGEEI